jgi:hypothetical protein
MSGWMLVFFAGCFLGICALVCVGQDKLDDILREARKRDDLAMKNWSRRLAEVEAEARRLREGIVEHRASVENHVMNLTPHPRDFRLWRLLNEEDSDG